MEWKQTDKYQRIMFGIKPDRPMSFTVKGVTVEGSKISGCLHWLSTNIFKQISVICQKAGQQTVAIIRLSTIIAMEVVILSNFNYCLVVWMLCGKGNWIVCAAVE